MSAVLRRSRSSNVIPITRQEGGLRATVFSVQRGDDSTSRQIALNDDFLSLASSAGAVVVLPTPYNVPRLFQLIDQSNMIAQCIEAFVTNTVETGWEVEAISRGKSVNESERMELDSFVEHANSEETLSDVMAKIIRDRESVGFGFKEVIRDAMGDVSLFRHCPAMWTRLCVKDPTEILVEYTISRGRRVSTVKEYRRFRRYVQIVNGGQVWFREFGDPRKMDWTNGAFEGQSGYQEGREATEIYHYKNPSNDSYGKPKWVNQLPNIIGSREAEEVNMRYFQDNTVPPLMMMIGNGRLTQQSYRELSNALNGGTLGKDRQHKIMLVEAVGENDSLDGKGSTIEMKVEKLTDTRQSDGLFKAYDEGNMHKVRSSFRLPPMIVGMSQDVTFASANTSVFVAESQVFGPARVKIDNALNKMFINGRDGLGMKTCKLVSRIPAITSPEMMIKTLTALNVMGAVTPRQAQKASNKVLQVEIEPYPEKGEEGYESWMDTPLPISQLKKAAAATQQTDPTGDSHDEQALKDQAIKDVEDDGDVSARQPKHGSE